ncbi:MAG TPA: Gfo/Idh/MocA family oxidoreductase [Polyangiaceae bacterium]|jgi:predicted dehydrogenase|nr:Gfo/Idh/MocA family oxidoreductase [Polyangiaceae bacterium]
MTGSRGPRLGFVGVGWIGLNRMQAAQAAGGEVVGIVDPDPAARARALESAPAASALTSFDELLELGLDGVVIATPNALHAEQCRAALRKGLAVFCQKPLARSVDEVSALVLEARAANRLLSVDLSYRGTSAAERVKKCVSSGELGRVYSAALTFHNGYGPDKAWFYDPALSGGGCMMDLGVHLVDTALWVLDFPRVERVEARRFARGVPLTSDETPEDFALGRMELEGGVVIDVACSWNLHVGCDAVISASFYGTEGGAEFHNVSGSFYDFIATRAKGTAQFELTRPPDPWGGRMITRWVEQLAASNVYRSEAEELLGVASVLDAFYRREAPRERGRDTMPAPMPVREAADGGLA